MATCAGKPFLGRGSRPGIKRHYTWQATLHSWIATPIAGELWVVLCGKG